MGDGSLLQATKTVHLRGLRQPKCARQKTKQTAQEPTPKTWEELHLPCVRNCTNRQAVRDSPCSHRQGPSRKRGKLTAAAISQTLSSSPWMKEGMKHQLPEAAVSVWPQQHSIRPPTIKGARDTGKSLTMLKDLYTTLPGNGILCIANKHAKHLSQLVYGLGCCLRVHTHS